MAKKKNLGLDKKTLNYIIAGFAVLVLGGVVWAASTGVLQITGSVSRGTSVDLDFITASCVTPKTGYGTDGVTSTGAAGGDLGCGLVIGNRPAVANGANDTLTFGMFLGDAGDAETVQFYIKNVGAVDTTLSAINVTDTTGFGASPTGNDITLGGTYASGLASPLCLEPGDQVGPFTISATWPSGLTGASGDASFAADLDYAEASVACI
ncbi:hypothetical protein FWH58_00255 [Candidatus Saccharibacteria bacterium]|nr:hypothetical protein [Candidatus Saccharibacteria bacterium]